MAQAQYQVGDHIENFTLPDTSGNMVSLYDYIDRLVVLAFWENG
jgi:peroxiredoxin